jgi:predicted CoA-substrate-specific enzyme activase
MAQRAIGIDVGAETLKVVEVSPEGGRLAWTRRALVEHGGDPGPHLRALLASWGWDDVAGAAACGRIGRRVNLPQVPVKGAQAAGFRFLHGDEPATVVSIGSHGFSVLEIRASGREVFRENSRCSQGTGNFLRQLVERFGLDIEEASRLAAAVDQAAPLSGRCPVILKTDMTHLANKGESKARILAGLFDAVAENVSVLVKPRVSPPRVALVGGVGRSPRVRATFRRYLEQHGMTFLDTSPEDGLYLEALGCALHALERPAPVPPLDRLIDPPVHVGLEAVPALRAFLPRVKRLAPRPFAAPGGELVLGFDIGSTGSKAVALDRATGGTAWEGYLRTEGDPVGAARELCARFVAGPAAGGRVLAFGATGSGREIVGSLLSACYGGDAVYVLNEIAAHAEGALHFDPRVDTIFEIGGQDAKYIRLAAGRVVDAAMNEACSAGTGSFIEEQGKKFPGVRDVAHLGQVALGADAGVSLGQHCSVFMAEIIDEAVAQGVAAPRIVAGIYDSIVQNYLNRVKGSRSVGQVIFCQGMPFAADALAAAVVRQTGAEVIVPPNPGTIGAVGIALLASKHLALAGRAPLDPARFLGARVEKKDGFVCGATKGCGGSGNRCRIDRISCVVADERRKFTWGGACSLWDRGTSRRKLPDRAPDPFREREELARALSAALRERRGRPTVAMLDEFQLKGLFPFFATLVRELGFDLEIPEEAGAAALKRGIEEANVPFCAPMQQYHGLVSGLAARDVDRLFLPMLRSLPRVAGEPRAAICPIVQASPDVLRWDLPEAARRKAVTPQIDIGEEGLESPELRESCRRIAVALGVPDAPLDAAIAAARAAQERFDAALLDLGRRALAFAAEHGLVPVVVLGRAYTIYNTVLNSNVPAILREQGAMAIPVDCYPVAPDVPVFPDVYWGYGQRILRAAYQVRRSPGTYALYCSNYSCGPDSFNLHFFAHLLDGKPFAVIETDGHSGDAGTKTRVEAFLHCVREDLAGGPRREARADLAASLAASSLADVRARGETLLVPPMGPDADVLAAGLRGVGWRAEALPPSDREDLRRGRRHTSGKECVPMTLTLGSLLGRLERAGADERFAFLMPRTFGPCRFGVYHLLHGIVAERLGHAGRIRIFSPADANYFAGMPPGFAALIYAGFLAGDLLLEGLYDVRPVERRPGAALAIYERARRELLGLLKDARPEALTLAKTLAEVATGRLFGVRDLLADAAREFAAVKGTEEKPTVLVVGEIYVRCDPFSNGFLVDRLEERGLKCRFAPFGEWLEYTTHVHLRDDPRQTLGAHVSAAVQAAIRTGAYRAMATPLAWPERTSVRQTLDAAADYLTPLLRGEAVLTLGGPIHEWREGRIDAAVSVGPLECMPAKIAEAQFFHVGEREGLPSLCLSLNGEPVPAATLDHFAFEVKRGWEKRRGARPGAAEDRLVRPSWLGRVASRGRPPSPSAS